MKQVKYYLLTALLLTASVANAQTNHWVGSWATAPEFTGQGDMPKTNLANHSLREIVKVSLGNKIVRLKLSNEFSKEPVEIRSIYIANAKDSSDIDTKSVKFVLFNKRKNVVIPAGKAICSDQLKFNLDSLSRISITINYGAKVPVNMTSHRGSRTTSYIAEGEVKPGKSFRSVEKLDHWYNISALEVLKDESTHAIAILGNSITDGRGSTTNEQNRWPDYLSDALDGQIGVLNLGIGGNCVIRGGLSQPAMIRFDRDILGQQGIDKIIIFEGTNDIGTSNGNSEAVAKELIESYKVLIKKAKDAGLKVYGATITPFKGNGWYSHFHDAARQTVNDWIRTSGAFDEVIDFDALVRDPSDVQKLRKEYSDDWLHLNPTGYEVMGEFAAKKLKN